MTSQSVGWMPHTIFQRYNNKNKVDAHTHREVVLNQNNISTTPSNICFIFGGIDVIIYIYI